MPDEDWSPELTEKLEQGSQGVSLKNTLGETQRELSGFNTKSIRKCWRLGQTWGYHTALTLRQRSSCSQLLISSTGNESNKLHLAGTAGRVRPPDLDGQLLNSSRSSGETFKKVGETTESRQTGRHRKHRKTSLTQINWSWNLCAN